LPILKNCHSGGILFEFKPALPQARDNYCQGEGFFQHDNVSGCPVLKFT
jgi:hypothetical protein